MFRKRSPTAILAILAGILWPLVASPATAQGFPTGLSLQ